MKGEFEVTQKLDTDKTKQEQKLAKKALSRIKSNNQIKYGNGGPLQSRS